LTAYLLSRNTSHGVNVLLQGVVPGCHSVPFHHIKWKWKVVSGQVVIGVGPTLPVEGISLLFNNFSFSFNVMEWNTMTTWDNPL
jgi:hypothetical protein